MADLGLPLANKKLTPRKRRITWLGITIDLDEMSMSIPPGKVKDTLQDIEQLYHKKAMCRRDVQRLAGRINHLGKACRPARLFMARILMYLRGHPPGYTKVAQGIRADLRWFLDFLPTFNGIKMIPPSPLTSRSRLTAA